MFMFGRLGHGLGTSTRLRAWQIEIDPSMRPRKVDDDNDAPGIFRGFPQEAEDHSALPFRLKTTNFPSFCILRSRRDTTIKAGNEREGLVRG